MTQDFGGGGEQKIVSKNEQRELWIDKYEPKSVPELAMNKKKVQEFVEIAEREHGILILHGPTGCGKTAMIKAFCTGSEKKLEKHKEMTSIN